jgi:hypothetical protein
MLPQMLVEFVLPVERLGRSAALEDETAHREIPFVDISHVTRKLIRPWKCGLAPGVLTGQSLLGAFCFPSAV